MEGGGEGGGGAWRKGRRREEEAGRRESGGTEGEGRGQRGIWMGREGGSAEGREGGRGAGRAWSGRRHGRGGSLPRPPGWRGRPRPTTPHRALTVWIFLKPNTYEGAQRLLCLRGLSTQALRHPGTTMAPCRPYDRPAPWECPSTRVTPLHDHVTQARPGHPSTATPAQRPYDNPALH